jgi:BirA family biotin operon repressor/biotin-[acetyl-CoA-carboxylase] ligase
MWEVEEIKKNLKTKIFGRQIHCFEEVGSTQDIAHTLASSGALEGTLVIAETQTQGKGRFLRSWSSPKGGLWFSLVLTPTLISLDQLSGLTILVALSIAKAIKNKTNIQPLIKWPNDLYVNNKKLAGILIESSTIEVAVKYIILGAGINVNIDSNSIPFGATSLMNELGKEVPMIELLSKILEIMEEDYLKFKKVQNLLPFLKEINKLSSITGKQVKVKLPNKSIQGYAAAVDEHGGLVIKLEDGQTQIITSGDVKVL